MIPIATKIAPNIMIASAASGLAGILVRTANIPRAISPIMATGSKSKHISIHIKSHNKNIIINPLIPIKREGREEIIDFVISLHHITVESL